MKRLVIAISILLLIFVLTLSHSFYISSFTRELTVLLENAEGNAEKGDWRSAEKLTQTALEKWEKKGTYLHILLQHSDNDSVYTNFQVVNEFIQCQEAGEYSAANARLIAELELLAEAEQLTLQNVL